MNITEFIVQLKRRHDSRHNDIKHNDTRITIKASLIITIVSAKSFHADGHVFSLLVQYSALS